MAAAWSFPIYVIHALLHAGYSGVAKTYRTATCNYTTGQT